MTRRAASQELRWGLLRPTDNNSGNSYAARCAKQGGLSPLASCTVESLRDLVHSPKTLQMPASDLYDFHSRTLNLLFLHHTTYYATVQVRKDKGLHTTVYVTCKNDVRLQYV